MRQRLHHVRFGSTSRCTVPLASRSPRPVARARLERLEHAERPVGFYDWRFFFRIARLYRTLTVCTLSSPQSHASPRHAEISIQISSERPRRALAPTGRMDFGCVRSVASASSSSSARSSSARDRYARWRVREGAGGARVEFASSSSRRRSTWRRSTSSRFARSRARARRWNFERNG